MNIGLLTYTDRNHWQTVACTAIMDLVRLTGFPGKNSHIVMTMVSYQHTILTEINLAQHYNGCLPVVSHFKSLSRRIGTNARTKAIIAYTIIKNKGQCLLPFILFQTYFKRILFSTTLTLDNAISALPNIGVISIGGLS